MIYDIHYMSTTLKNEIKKIARDSVREALRHELTLLRVLHLPMISNKEQKNIEKLYKTPSRYAVRSTHVDI